MKTQLRDSVSILSRKYCAPERVVRLFVLFIALMLPAGAPQADTSDIRVGMSAAFSGPTQGLGIELYRGAAAYFACQ